MEPNDTQAEVTRAKADLIAAQKNMAAAGAADDEKHSQRMSDWHSKARKHFDDVSVKAIIEEKSMCDAEKAQIEADMHASEQRMEEMKGKMKDLEHKKAGIEKRHKKMEDDIKAEDKASEDAKKEAVKGEAKEEEDSKKAAMKTDREAVKK